jgi:hypothetical protein
VLMPEMTGFRSANVEAIDFIFPMDEMAGK